MFAVTHQPAALWTVVLSNDKKRGRLEAMRTVLARLHCPDKDPLLASAPDPLIVGSPHA